MPRTGAGGVSMPSAQTVSRKSMALPDAMVHELHVLKDEESRIAEGGRKRRTAEPEEHLRRTGEVETLTAKGAA